MKTRKLLALLGAAILTVGSLTACGAAEETTQEDNAQTAVVNNESQAASSSTADSQPAEVEIDDSSASITMAGSTSMKKLANAVAESFMEKYPQITVTAEFTGSGAGIESLLAGSVDIGNSSRNLKEEEKASGAVENIVAIDGIAVVVDPANVVTELTKDQLSAIYKGEVTSWSELGGAEEPIVVVGREAGSGTRGAFEELLEVEDACAYANELDSTGAVMAKVASTPGAIGYVSLDVVDTSVVTVSLDGVEATVENIKAGNYLLSRPFVMATNGEISAQNDAIQTFFEYLSSEEGREVISGVGLITVD